MRYTRHLDFFETPDYNYLRKLFADVMARSGWDFDWVFDWTNRIQVYLIGLEGRGRYLVFLGLQLQLVNVILFFFSLNQFIGLWITARFYLLPNRSFTKWHPYHITPLPNGTVTKWHLYRIAPSRYGTFTQWHCHQMAPLPYGTFNKWHL